MSGSLKYVVGGAFGPKSRGGLVTVLGGATCGMTCASTAERVSITPPATPSVVRRRRREIDPERFSTLSIPSPAGGSPPECDEGGWLRGRQLDTGADAVCSCGSPSYSDVMSSKNAIGS